MGLDLLVTLSLGIGVAFLLAAARRLRAAPSILMLLAGVAIAFVPGLPTVTLKPDLVLLLLLPPLLYWSCVGMSWREFRFNLARDPRDEVMLALVTPFVAFWPPHGTGLYVSWSGRRLIRTDTRLQGFFIWDLVTWTIEALTFRLMGLQAHRIAGNLSAAGWVEFLQAGAVVTLTTIVARFAWVHAEARSRHAEESAASVRE